MVEAHEDDGGKGALIAVFLIAAVAALILLVTSGCSARGEVVETTYPDGRVERRVVVAGEPSEAAGRLSPNPQPVASGSTGAAGASVATSTNPVEAALLEALRWIRKGKPRQAAGPIREALVLAGKWAVGLWTPEGSASSDPGAIRRPGWQDTKDRSDEEFEGLNE